MYKKIAQMTNNISGVFTFEDTFYKQNKNQIDDYFAKAKDSLIFKTLIVTHTGSFNFTMQARQNITYFAPYIFKPNNINYLPIFFDLYKLIRDAKTTVRFSYSEYDKTEPRYLVQTFDLKALPKPKNAQYFKLTNLHIKS